MPTTGSPISRAARRRQRTAAAILGLAAAAGLGLGLRPVAEPEAQPFEAVPVVSAWSARRFPVTLSETVGNLRLPQEVDGAVEGSDACFVIRAETEDVYVRDRTMPLTPASTQKLLLGAAVLSVLGPDHRLETRVVAPDTEGSSVDRLWLVGGGDPFLMTADYAEFLDDNPLTVGHPRTPLEALADDVVASGVEEVTGGIVGDASRHSGAPTVPTWKDSYITDHNVSFLSALTVNGGWSEWEPSRVTAPDPAVEAAEELAELLRDRGVTVEGEIATGEAPSGAERVAAVESPSVTQMVMALIRESDNLVAELLLRELAVADGREGTTPAGASVVTEALERLGVNVEGVRLRDGSGLDRNNRATCGATMGALELRHQDEFAAIDEGLAVAGISGTLHRRLEETPLEGTLRAKTGSLDGVVGLVGVLDRPRPLVFSMLANGEFSSAEGSDIQDEIAHVLHDYPFTFPDPEVLAPPSARPAGEADE